MRLAALVACVASLALVAAGCGGEDDRVSAGEWAEAFCTATRDWSDEMSRIAGSVADRPPRSLEALEEVVRDTRGAIDTYVDELRSLDEPDLDGGAQVESSIEALAAEVESEAEEIEDTLEDVSGITGPVTSGRDVGASIVAMFTAFERASETIESADEDGELEQAFADTEACDEIGS
jgi:hypothetical protein